MKKLIFATLIIVLPLLLLSINPGIRDVLQKMSYPSFAADRGIWRLTESEFFTHYDFEWQPHYTSEYHYNQTFVSRPDSIRLWYYNYELNSWSLAAFGTYSYNASGYVASFTVTFFSNFSEVSAMRSEFLYDAQNRLTRACSYALDTLSQQWYPEQRMHIIYSGATYEVYFWNADWSNQDGTYSKINFSWDNHHRIIEQIESDSIDSLYWAPDSRTTTSYHPNDTLTGDQFVHWIAWYLPLSFMFGHQEAPGMFLEEIRYVWYMNGWIPDQRDTYSHGADDLLYQRIGCYWDMDVWNEMERKLYSYDAHGNREQEIVQFWNGGPDWSDAELSTYNWEYYSSANDDPGFPANPGIKLHAYPVPFSENLNLRLDSNAKSEVNFR
ncbi:MAG: hypothetical protein Q8M98_03975, partial [Candidatus Cloacimonadaceae bacterium]|nr:hypothetical protein [Candidatus Cloacimonadaceae bacterium]